MTPVPTLRPLLVSFLLAAPVLFGQAPNFSVPDAVDVKADLVYAQYGEKGLRLDLYLPKTTPAGAIPGIIVVRGGGWRAGDKDGFAPIAAGLAARGFAAACIEYRVLPDFTIRDAVNDTKAAVRWMRANATRYGIRADAIGAIGGSAGGHLVSLLATSHKVAELEGAGGPPGVSSRLQAVVAMAPVVDFAAMGPRGATGTTLFGDNVELATLLSAVTHVDKDSAPFLLIHGNADTTVPIAQSQQMLERCQRAGVPVELVTLDGAPHAFWHTPAWSSDTVERAARFFHAVLDAKAGAQRQVVSR